MTDCPWPQPEHVPHHDVRAIIERLRAVNCGVEAMGLEARVLLDAARMLAKQSHEIAHHRSDNRVADTRPYGLNRKTI